MTIMLLIYGHYTLPTLLHYDLHFYLRVRLSIVSNTLHTYGFRNVRADNVIENVRWIISFSSYCVFGTFDYGTALEMYIQLILDDFAPFQVDTG